MILEWRKIWNSFTPTSDSFPFGFMQLSTIDASNLTNANPNIPVIRWHQTADYGFVPNEAMEVREAETILKIRNLLSTRAVLLMEFQVPTAKIIVGSLHKNR